MTPQWDVCVISTCRRPMDTKLGKLLTCSERIPSLRQHDSLITWPTCHVIILKIYSFTNARLIANKPGRVVTYGKRFNMQTLVTDFLLHFTIKHFNNADNKYFYFPSNMLMGSNFKNMFNRLFLIFSCTINITIDPINTRCCI